MINFDFDKDCCGCTACMNSCNHDAISMIENSEGFLMPFVDKEKCVDCGLCDKACPHLNTSYDCSSFSLGSFSQKNAYLYFSNKAERINSASGGFVYDAYRKVLSENGYICGCVWNDNMEAVHIITDNDDNLHALQSSKYVQSNPQDSYKKIKQFLREGKKVAFCGTPCQTAGLNTYLANVNKDNLISISLICHGIASPGVWKKWVKIMEAKYHGKLVDVNMRDKSYEGYSTTYCKYTFVDDEMRMSSVDSGNKKVKFVGRPSYLADPYVFLFTDNLFLRHSCTHCQYKADQNGADIIVGDYFKSISEAGNDGCSCLFAMTTKGIDFIKSLDGTLMESDYKTIGSVNSMLWKSVGEHPRRKEFFNMYHCCQDTHKENQFIDFLPFRFHVKRILHQMGVFNYWLMVKRKMQRKCHK